MHGDHYLARENAYDLVTQYDGNFIVVFTNSLLQLVDAHYV